MAMSGAPELKMFLNQVQGQQVYYPGQVISGSIQMTLTEPMWYQYVAMHLRGKGKVHWTETHMSFSDDNRMHLSESDEWGDSVHSADEIYTDLSVVVWGNREVPKPTKLDPGTFNFPFQFTIPPHCPPTFKSGTGKIKYKLFGIISNQVGEYKIKMQPIIISTLVDLNQQPHLLQPINKSTVRTVHNVCGCSIGEAQFTLKIPRTGFCIAQERIHVTLEYRNSSTKQLTAKLEVMQYVVCNARGGDERKEFETISSFSCSIEPSESNTKVIEFDLPPSVILGFTTQILTVSHSINLWIGQSWDILMLTPRISVPLVIGNVPFHGTEQPSLPPSSTQPSAAVPPSLQQQPGYPPQEPGVPPVAMRQPNVIEIPKLQSHAPPTYKAVISGEKF